MPPGRIDLEYRPPTRGLGRGLLVAGLLMATVTALAWFEMTDEVRVWERVIAAQPGKADEVRTPDPALALKLEQAGDVIRRLSLPWEKLFRGMEEAASDRIALLGVEPDPARQLVTLSGEAQAYAEVLRYMTRLDAGAVLTRPQLRNHEVRGEGTQRPVAFAITAHWEAVP